MAGALSERGELVPGTKGPYVIAHAAGNNEWRVHDALEAGADLVEVDLWTHNGQFEARHERRFGRIPLLFEKWYVRRPDGPFKLTELLAQTDTHSRLFLDLKTGGMEPVRLLERALEESPPALAPAASSQSWSVLRNVRAALPAIPIFYSMSVRAQLDLFLSTMTKEQPPDGVSCRHTLLDAETIQRLREAGMTIVAWTVDDGDRASDLVRAGADAITTHEIVEIRSAIGGSR